jgi:hypothetical protein
MHKFVTWSAIALSSTALSALPFPAVAASPQATPIPFSEPAPPRIDATTQAWLDRLWQVTQTISAPEEKSATWLRVAELYTDTYQNSQKGGEAITQAIAAAQLIPNPADRADALLQILLQFQRTRSTAVRTAAVETLDLTVEAIALVPDMPRRDGLLEFAIIAATDLEPFVQLKPAVQPLALVERIHNPQNREYQRSLTTKVMVRRMIEQNQLEAAIDLIQQTPLLPFYAGAVEPDRLTNPSRDERLLAKVEHLEFLIGNLFLQTSGDMAVVIEPDGDAIAAKMRPIAQAWIDPIQDPYLKAKAQTSWLGQLHRLKQTQAATNQFQALLQTLSLLSAQQKIELLLPLLQYSWENDPQWQPLSQPLLQTLRSQLNAIGNSESVQSSKAQLLLDAIYSQPYGNLSLMTTITDETNQLTDAKLRSELLYAIGMQYEMNNNTTTANAIYQQILPIIDQLEDATQATTVLIKLGRDEEAIARAKASGEDDVLLSASTTFITQPAIGNAVLGSAIAPALELARLIQDPASKVYALSQISSILSSNGQPNALEPIKEALNLAQTLPVADQVNIGFAMGYFLEVAAPLQLLEPFEPTVQVSVLLSMVENYGWAESERNNQVAQRLVELVPRLTQTEQKHQALSTLAYLDAADQPNRVTQWVDQMPPAAQADALLRAIYLRSHLSTAPFQP